ncbi:Hypothetical predicted protein [Cloeon dipterum]|uniref:Uncharacterized protein n=1 Tax=Cloeon dipterum TaxID=197152 RepID=A0A8S1C0H0_9INSE|nr:Hypothetical predicted protein [Cloeon dipterum]
MLVSVVINPASAPSSSSVRVALFCSVVVQKATHMSAALAATWAAMKRNTTNQIAKQEPPIERYSLYVEKLTAPSSVISSFASSSFSVSLAWYKDSSSLMACRLCWDELEICLRMDLSGVSALPSSSQPKSSPAGSPITSENIPCDLISWSKVPLVRMEPL